MKQTAVEWLYDNLNKCFNRLDNGKYDYTDFVNASKEVREQAKEMEKEQQGYSEEDMKSAFQVGFNVGYNDNESPSYLTFDEWFNKFKNK